MAEKKQLSPNEYSPARKEVELEKEQKQKEMGVENMTNTKKKAEKKQINKSEEIKNWNDTNKDYNIDTKTQAIKLPDSVKIEKLTDAINVIRRLRTLLKKLGYSTSERKGKYI